MYAPGALSAFALGAALGAMTPAPAETVIAPFDLAGWRKSGALTLETPAARGVRAEALVDLDPQTAVVVPGESAEFSLSFQPAQSVRRVSVLCGGDQPAQVRLIVVEPEGGRFQAGSFDAVPGQPVGFQLRDVIVSRLIVSLESAAEDDKPHTVALADVEVIGALAIQSISLEDVPATLPEGGSFPYRVLGLDDHGGRVDLTDRATLVVTPPPALTLLPEFRAMTRVQGPLTIQPHLQSLSGLPRAVLVTALDPPPPPPVASEGLDVVTLDLEGAPPFEVFRRLAGETGDVALGRTDSSRFHDDSVLPGVAYAYSVRRVDRFDNPLTGRSAEVRVRTWSRLPPGWTDVGRLPVLMALFSDSLSPRERLDIVASAEHAALFVYKHSLGRVVLDLTFFDVPGPTPVTTGPTMLGIEQRLRQLGVRDGQYGVVFAVASDLAGDYAGFRILGDGVGIMGRGARVPTPPGAMGPDPAFAWSFVHELQHALAALLDPFGPQPSGHFAEDLGPLGVLGAWRGRPFDAGESWDGEAWLLADLDGWAALGRPWKRPLEVLDTDADGLPDADARLPLDEARFGSDPQRPDSDGDGLADLGEAAAGLYRGTDPTRLDTDGDGLFDGVDPWPLSNFSGAIARGPHPRTLASLPTRAEPQAPGVELRASWTEAALLLDVYTALPCDAFLDLDGSGRLGRWETDVDTGPPGSPASDVWAGPARIALRAHCAPLGVFVGGKPLTGARVTATRESDGRWKLSASLPRALGPGAPDVYIPPEAPAVSGLRLRAGTVLGLAVTLRPSRPDESDPFLAHPADGDWMSLFETHRLMDAELED
jgi:hypothetical protein